MHWRRKIVYKVMCFQEEEFHYKSMKEHWMLHERSSFIAIEGSQKMISEGSRTFQNQDCIGVGLKIVASPDAHSTPVVLGFSGRRVWCSKWHVLVWAGSSKT
jgi:hypothetical protein